MSERRLGVDLGGSKILAGLVVDGQVAVRAKRSTKGDLGYEGVLKRVCRTIYDVVEAAGISLGRGADIEVIGLGVPGPVAGGMLLGAANLGWPRSPLARDLGGLLGVDVVLGNDVNFGALGESTHGAAAGCRSAFAAFMGTGLGGALVLDGKVLAGAHGMAGEFGHIPGPFDAAQCSCGQRGCLETVASKWGIVRLLDLARSSGRPVAVEAGIKLKSRHLLTAFEAGCEATRDVVNQAGRALGWGLGLVQAVADPEVFILGGGVVDKLSAQLLPAIDEGLSQYGFLRRQSSPAVRLAALGDDAVVVGAAVAAGQGEEVAR